jgi:hypothetical protein
VNFVLIHGLSGALDSEANNIGYIVLAFCLCPDMSSPRSVHIGVGREYQGAEEPAFGSQYIKRRQFPPVVEGPLISRFARFHGNLTSFDISVHPDSPVIIHPDPA